ncbi:hypothetical protein E4U14_006335, partial [Claviceps sp. LM454 group G7]
MDQPLRCLRPRPLVPPALQLSGLGSQPKQAVVQYATFSWPRPTRAKTVLFLNVFAPGAAPWPSPSKAVMVWLHGGSFQFGSGMLPAYDGNDFAARQNIVVVTLNYRVAAFGGNPRRVTIFGESAGAGGVDMLVTSPPATDALPFAAAIMQSGFWTGHDSVGRSGAQFAAFVA